jgi:hypothetical protein
MSVRSAQSVTKVFTTRRFDTGAATNADSTPAGTLYVNGTANGATVTVTNITTGVYKAAVTLPTLAVGDVVDLRISATVNAVTDNAVVWVDAKDIVIDSAGLADANTVKLGPSGSGTAQTARDIGASVLLSAGTGTGQLDFTSGVVKANAVQWLGGTIPAVNVTGVPLVDAKYLLGTIFATPATAGVLDANVKNVNNVSASGVTTVSANVGTTQPVNFTGTGASAFVKSDLTRWLTGTPNALVSGDVSAYANVIPVSERDSIAGDVWTNAPAYLANLNVGGAVASHADILAINQSASKHLLIQTVGQYERPESGSTTYTVEARTFAATTGAAVNADSTPTLTATGQTSGSLAANLSAATTPATGVYRWTYTVSSAATIEPVRFDVSATISTATFTLSTYTQVADFVATTFTTSDRTTLNAIATGVTVAGYATGQDPATWVWNALVVNYQASNSFGEWIDTVQDAVVNNGVFLAASQPAYAPAVAGDAMTLTPGERTAVAAAVGSTTLAAGTVASTTGTTTTLDAGAVAAANFYNGESIVITGGVGAGQSAIIAGYSVGRVVTHAAWTINPNSSSTYAIRTAKSSATITGGGDASEASVQKVLRAVEGIEVPAI